MIPVLTFLVGLLLGLLCAAPVRRWLDGTRRDTPTSPAMPPVAPAPPAPPLPTDGLSAAALRELPFTVETVQRVADGLRGRYADAGGYMPSEAELREQALRALSGQDIL